MKNKGHSNLIPPKDGEVRNPNGRPKGSVNSKTILRKFLSLTKNGNNPFTGENEDFSIAEIIHLKQIERALNGDLASFKEITDRLEGRTTAIIEQKSEVTQKIKVGFSDNEDGN